MEEFDANLTAGNVKAAMRDTGAVSADLWQVAPDRLHVIDGFNIRVKNDAYAARVRWIADSIKANGYYKDKPLSGFVAKKDGVDVIYITGGHRRYEAVNLAISEGADIPNVPIVIKPRGTNMEDLTVDLIVGNEGEPVTTYEQAIGCKRLAGFGWESKEIARRIGYASAQYVDGLLSLAGAPLGLRKMVIEQVVSATTAIEAIKKHGEKATEVLAAALAKSGAKRVTAKVMPENNFKKAVKKAAPDMHQLLFDIMADPGFGNLSPEITGKLTELLNNLKKPEVI